jgi:Helicase associated domain
MSNETAYCPRIASGMRKHGPFYLLYSLAWWDLRFSSSLALRPTIAKGRGSIVDRSDTLRDVCCTDGVLFDGTGNSCPSSIDGLEPCESRVERKTIPGVRIGWTERFRQLQEFKDRHGHTLVPKRYKENPSLGNWVNKQRQQYRNFLSGAKPCSLTDRRIEQLKLINFCWNATVTSSSSLGRNSAPSKDTMGQWWVQFEELRDYCLATKDSIRSGDGFLVNFPRQTRLSLWVDRQRRVYHGSRSIPSETNRDGKLSTIDDTEVLSKGQVDALSSIDPSWWMTRRQWQWECRLRELHDYARRHGHCCVPISFTENKLLAHWVSNQRKQYNLKKAGLPTDLTDDRFQRLEAIGFVWNRWDYEFSKKSSQWENQ